jgi:ADP-ribose pyrophosphatase YjhB (NUDIX family)
MNKKKYLEALPKKRMAAGVMFFNQNGELLILKPIYKDGWTIPGGIVDQDESPRECCQREIKEEISLDIKELAFVCVDYKHKQGYSESLQFMFYGGILREEQIEKIKLDRKELSEFKFVSVREAVEILSPNLRKRILDCRETIKNKKAIYLENGEK